MACAVSVIGLLAPDDWVRCVLYYLHNSRSFHFCFVDCPERCVRSSPSTHHRASSAPCFRNSPRAFRITGLRASFAREAFKPHRILNPLKDNPRTSYRPEGGFIGMVWYGMVRYGTVWYGMVWYVCMCVYIYIHMYMYIYIYI